MKITRLEKIYAVLLLVVFGGVIIHTPLSVGLGVLFPDYDLLIKSWKEILMLLLIPVAVIIVTRRRLWHEFLKDWIFRLIVALALLHIIMVLIFPQGLLATMAGMAIDVRYVLFFALVYIMVRAMPHYKQLFLRIGIIGACIVVGCAVLQLFLPPDFLKVIGYSNDTIAPYLTVDKNPDYIRVNSTLRGPNPLGAYAGIVLAILAAAYAKGKLQLRNNKMLAGTIALAVCNAVALWVSYSRSAIVAGIIGVLLVFAVTIGRKIPRQGWVAICIVTLAVVGALAVGRGSTFVSNVLLHENPNGGSDISSNEGHVSSLESGVRQFIQQPFGVGVGSTGSASLYGNSPFIIENQYLFVAHETGWLGLALFLGLFLLILVRLWQKRTDWLSLGVFASGISLALIGLLLPVWVDDTVSIVWWGLAAIALAGGDDDRKKTK
jgi:dolichol kinase